MQLLIKLINKAVTKLQKTKKRFILTQKLAQYFVQWECENNNNIKTT